MESLTKSYHKELQYSGLTVLMVVLGPASFVSLQNLNISMWISFTVFFGFLLLGFFFQTLRRRETRKIHQAAASRKFVFQIGDCVEYQGRDYVVLKYGFNHYYLKDLKSEQIMLAKRNRVEAVLSLRTVPKCPVFFSTDQSKMRPSQLEG